MKSNLEILQQATTLLKRYKRPYIITHPRPDGDTIGSALALRLALLELGKEPLVVCVHPIPETMAYLPGTETVGDQVPAQEDIDLIVAVDMSDLKRTGGMVPGDWRDTKPILVIDHHETNDNFGDVNLVEAEAAATAMPMLALLKALGTSITPDIATCLLTAVLTDTRGLRTETTTPDVLRMVSELIEAGGDYATVVQNALDSTPYKQMRGWGIALNRLQLEGQVAWTTFPKEEKETLGIDDHDDLNLGNLLSQVAEAKVIASFLEMRNRTVKISLRARPGYNVAGVAKSLGGGGHRQAAGCSVQGSLTTATAKVLPLLHKLLETNS
ncbi:MAG: bifunctional oligoribonuclease/PAP phosphatase NrnA [Anaerolineae bacterium]|nr:bifunctional oligoribonuclease/PAP phosphatase NrnA [Anaerolineae bacterium]